MTTGAYIPSSSSMQASQSRVRVTYAGDMWKGQMPEKVWSY